MAGPLVIFLGGLALVGLLAAAGKKKQPETPGGLIQVQPGQGGLPGQATIQVPVPGYTTPQPTPGYTAPTTQPPGTSIVPGVTIQPSLPTIPQPNVVGPGTAISQTFQQAIAAVLGKLVDQNGNPLPTVKSEDIQQATALAGQLDAAGYSVAAGQLREYAKLAGKYVAPTPIAQQAPLPGMSPEIAATVNRALQVERDPKVLRQLASSLRTLPGAQNAEVQTAITMVEALATQLEHQMQTAQVLNQIQDTLNQANKGTVVTTPGVSMPRDFTIPQQQVTPAVQPRVITVPTPRTTTPTAPRAVPPTPTAPPVVAPTVPSPIQAAAAAMVANMKKVQAAASTVKASKGKEDQSLVKRFQGLAGISTDGKAGPGALLKAAENGQFDLPYVMYWPTSATSKNVLAYRSSLQDIADQVQAQGNAAGASALRTSASRERGQAGIVGTMPA